MKANILMLQATISLLAMIVFGLLLSLDGGHFWAWIAN
jgi:hypothetical protein